VVPSEHWGGEGLLGLQVRFDAVDAPGAPEEGEDEEWAMHVVGVDEGSPAAGAGVAAFDDFILGSHDIAFADMAALTDYIYRCAGEDVILYLYRASCDAVYTRLISIPDSGSLGVEVAAGRLHSLPNRETDGVCEDGGRVEEGGEEGYSAAGAGAGAAGAVDRRAMGDFLGSHGGQGSGSGSGSGVGDGGGAGVEGMASSHSSAANTPGFYYHPQQQQQQQHLGTAAQAQFPCPEEQATGRCAAAPNCPFSHQQHSGGSTSSFGSAGAFPQSPAPPRQPQLHQQQQQQQQYYQQPQLLQPQQQQQHQPSFQPPQQQQFSAPLPYQQFQQPQPAAAAPVPAPWQPAPIRIPGSDAAAAAAFTPTAQPGSGSGRPALQPFQPVAGGGAGSLVSPHPPLPRSPAPAGYPRPGAGGAPSLLQPPPSPFAR
jgi:hypothetical protein